MTSLILRTTTRFVHPLLVLFSLFLLWRGHHEPGGGFVAGLVAATAATLFALAYGPAEAARSLWVEPQTLLGAGLFAAAASGMWPLVRGEPYLTARWLEVNVPGLGALDLGTPLLFDVGVYLVVLGAVARIVLALVEEE
ncbi:MAG TPA: Na+/H+ antiporter subunit B [Thermoanaerobaculia bacterium]|nr:Na+/H+ antiporter subunit B [Thermoanaerobaculia bacterium]